MVSLLLWPLSEDTWEPWHSFYVFYCVINVTTGSHNHILFLLYFPLYNTSSNFHYITWYIFYLPKYSCFSPPVDESSRARAGIFVCLLHWLFSGLRQYWHWAFMHICWQTISYQYYLTLDQSHLFYNNITFIDFSNIVLSVVKSHRNKYFRGKNIVSIIWKNISICWEFVRIIPAI